MNRKWMLIFVLLMLPAFSASQTGWLSDWSYRKAIEVSNTGSQDLYNFQLNLTLDTKTLIAAGKMRADCADLRFADEDGTDLLGYWIESGCNTTSTFIWVRVPFIPASQKINIYAYYGNPEATSTSSGEQVFSLFDDFNSNTIGTTWQVYDGATLRNTATGYAYISITNSSAVIDSVSSHNLVSKDFRMSRPFIAEIKTWFQGDFSGEGYTMGLIYYDPEKESSFNRYSYHAFVNASGSCIRYGGTGDSQDYPPDTGGSPEVQTWYINRMTINQTHVGSSLLWTNYSLVSSALLEDGDWNGNKISIDNYNDGSSGEKMYVDWVRVRAYATTPPTVTPGLEIQKPSLSYTFEGSEVGNMRTLIFVPVTEKNTVKIELEPIAQCELVSSGVASLTWGTFGFNTSGYYVNQTFRWISSDEMSYRENCERITVQFHTITGGQKVWHLVQAFKDVPIIKHVIFVHTTGAETDYNESIILDSLCESFENVSGSHVCSTNMHSSSGHFETSDAVYCNIHWGSNENFYLKKVIKISDGYGKGVFWEALDNNCNPFLQEIELICGLDFQNCTSTSANPIRIPFYTSDTRKQLGRLQVFGDSLDVKLNGLTVEGQLLNTKYISQGVNYLELGGSGTVNEVRVILSRPYTATLFFGEKPTLYKLNVKGPVDGSSAGVAGIPVTDRILPFKHAEGKTHMDLGIGSGTVEINLFKTSDTWLYEEGGMYAEKGSLTQINQNFLPLAGSHNFLSPRLPPTHEVCSSSRVYYANSTILEVVITTWKSI